MHNNEDELCLICWLPTYENKNIEILPAFSHIKPRCNCKPKLHLECIDKWVNKTSSCPVCRTKLYINIYTYDNLNFNNFCIVCQTFINDYIHIIHYFSIANLFFLFLFNTYYISIYIYNKNIIQHITDYDYV